MFHSLERVVGLYVAWSYLLVYSYEMCMSGLIHRPLRWCRFCSRTLLERVLHSLWSRPSNGNRLAHDALDLLQRLLREMFIACKGGLFELSRIARSDNGYINRGLRLAPSQHPGDGQLRDRHSLSGRQALQVLDDCDIALEMLAVEELALAAPVIRCEGRLWRERSAKQSMRQRTVHEYPDAGGLAIRQ